MRRHVQRVRADWRPRVESIGLSYHTHEDGPYWDESVAYELTAREVDELESAANRLHALCIEAAGAVIEKGWWGRLAIPEAAIPVIERSWERDDFSLYGRFDLAYDGSGSPKLLEYNADTPTALIEASVAQWYWLQDLRPDADQFNSIHERLIVAWKRSRLKRVEFCSVKDHPEDEQTVRYLEDTAHQAGCITGRTAVEDIGWDRRRRQFVDMQARPIEAAFKLYPWEWMWAEEFAANLPLETTQWIEPAWKMLLSNKGLLSILWELFPGHVNLLPAYDSPERLGGDYVRKPRLSREGANVTRVERGRVVCDTPGEYGEEGYVYQALAPLAQFDGKHAVMGVWVVDHEAAGLGIREDSGPVTGNLSRFVPHWFGG